MPRLLPEWAPQRALMLTWPRADGDWGSGLAAAEESFTAIARQAPESIDLIVSCADETHRQHVHARLVATGIDPRRMHLHIVPSNDSWARDHGPLGVAGDTGLTLVDFRFNGWGGKYRADRDDGITARLQAEGAFGAVPLRRVNVVLEGGAVETDGAGALLATRSSILTDTRNPGLTQGDIENLLRTELGLTRFLWLDHGWLAGDDTDGHIDMLARFCSRDRIAHASCDDPTDEHHEPLAALRRELEALRTPDGRPYTLVPLPIPAPRLDDEGQRMPASHANFLILNERVLVPVYDDPADAIVMRRLQDCFPGRGIVGINALPLIAQHGSLHCVTMQIPATPQQA